MSKLQLPTVATVASRPSSPRLKAFGIPSRSLDPVFSHVARLDKIWSGKIGYPTPALSPTDSEHPPLFRSPYTHSIPTSLVDIECAAGRCKAVNKPFSSQRRLRKTMFRPCSTTRLSAHLRRALATHAAPPTTPATRHSWTKQEIQKIYDSPLLDLVFRAASVHRQYHDPSKIQLCTLMNIKSEFPVVPSEELR